MALSRYRNLQALDGKYYETFNVPAKEELDKIPTYSVIANRFDRLDNLAFKYLGDGAYWWVIALVNNLGWAFAFEEGQVLKIPIDVQDVLRIV